MEYQDLYIEDDSSAFEEYELGGESVYGDR